MGMRDEFPIADLQLRPNAAKFIGTLYDEIDRLRAEIAEDEGVIKALRRQRDTAENELQQRKDLDGWNVHG